MLKLGIRWITYIHRLVQVIFLLDRVILDRVLLIEILQDCLGALFPRGEQHCTPFLSLFLLSIELLFVSLLAPFHDRDVLPGGLMYHHAVLLNSIAA